MTDKGDGASAMAAAFEAAFRKLPERAAWLAALLAKAEAKPSK